MPEGQFSPDKLINRIRRKLEREPQISATSVRLMEDAYRRWNIEAHRPIGEWGRRLREYGPESSLSVLDRTIELSWFLFFEMYEFTMTNIFQYGSRPKEEVRKKNEEYAHLLKDAIKFQKWLNSPSSKRGGVSLPKDYLKEHCLSLIAEHWDERLQGTPMTTLKMVQRLSK